MKHALMQMRYRFAVIYESPSIRHVKNKLVRRTSSQELRIWSGSHGIRTRIQIIQRAWSSDPTLKVQSNMFFSVSILSLSNSLSNISRELRPLIVHKINKNTSGLVIIAKNNQAHEHLSNQFSKHTITRTYQLLIWGKIRPSKGRIETLITRSSKNRQMMEVNKTKGKKIQERTERIWRRRVDLNTFLITFLIVLSIAGAILNILQIRGVFRGAGGARLLCAVKKDDSNS